MNIKKLDTIEHKKPLSKLCIGELFEYNDMLYIKSDTIDENGIVCLVMCSGRLTHLPGNVLINEVEVVSINDDTMGYCRKIKR